MPTGAFDPVRGGIFYAVALGLAVCVALVAPLSGEATKLTTMLTPAAAVLFMLVVTPGGPGVVSLLGLNRSGIGIWWLAFVGPLAILAVSDLVLVMVGVASFSTADLAAEPLRQAFRLVVGFGIGLVFAFTEEIGWRGYLLPRLAGLRLLPAMLLTGFLHGVWHLPLILFTPYYHAEGNVLLVIALFLTTLTLAGVFYGFLRASSGSVWPAVIAHAFFNAIWGFGDIVLQPLDAVTMEYFGGESGVVVVALLVLLTFLLRPAIHRIERRRFEAAGA